MATLKERLDAMNIMVGKKLTKLQALKEDKSNKVGSVTVGVTDSQREYPNIQAVIDFVNDSSNNDQQYIDDEIADLVTQIAATYIPLSQKGQNNGVATLDGNGTVPASQLPSFVDDVIEVTNYADLPSSGEGGKIYTTLNDNKIYRWSGSGYIQIPPSLAIGILAGTAFEGNRGRALELALASLTTRVGSLEDEFETYYKAMDGNDFPDYATLLDNATSAIIVN